MSDVMSIHSVTVAHPSAAVLRQFWQGAMFQPAQSVEVVSGPANLYRAFFAANSASAIAANKRSTQTSEEKTTADKAILIKAAPAVISSPTPAVVKTETVDAVSLVQRLKRGLTKTRQQFSLTQLFSSKPQNVEALLTALETQLLIADVGVAATDKLLAAVRRQITKEHLSMSSGHATPGVGVKNLLRQAMLEILERPQADPFAIQPWPAPFVVLMVGVNGVGKTTTLGKLSKQLVGQGHSVLLAAGDTFRAAAIEQLQTWGERNQIPVVAQQAGADAAAVIYDAISRAKARQIDVVLADTAGRLHNKAHLMDELSKMVRVIKKQDASAPHAILLVVDATTGQNAIAQAKVFQQLIGVTGIVLTKLDGTAKGGIAFALVEQLQLPICYVGVGEQIDDLKPFVASDFVDALLEMDVEPQVLL